MEAISGTALLEARLMALAREDDRIGSLCLAVPMLASTLHAELVGRGWSAGEALAMVLSVMSDAHNSLVGQVFPD